MLRNDFGPRKIFQKCFIRDSVTNLQPNENRKQSGIAMFFTEAQVSRIKSKNLMDHRLQVILLKSKIIEKAFVCVYNDENAKSHLFEYSLNTLRNPSD